MWWLFLLLVLLLWEGIRYHTHRRLVTKWRSKHRLTAPIRNAWNVKYESTVPNITLHRQLAQKLVVYDTYSVLNPQYKPVLYYNLLRGVHETAYAIAKYYGWRCYASQGVWFWERGSGSTLLFLHGFGFGPYAYGRVLHELSKQYRVVAPQYPGLSYDGRTDIPDIQDYAHCIKCYLGDQRYCIVSNSFGTIVHHALLRDLGSLAVSRVEQQIYVEPVCFYPYAGQLFSFVEFSTQTCLAAPTWRAFAVASLSYLLVAKDCSTLYLCQQILEDPKWDGESYLPLIPSTIVLSERDSLIRVPELRDYFQLQHPQCNVIVLQGAYHGEALFSPQLKINTLLFPCVTKE